MRRLQWLFPPEDLPPRSRRPSWHLPSFRVFVFFYGFCCEACANKQLEVTELVGQQRSVWSVAPPVPLSWKILALDGLNGRLAAKQRDVSVVVFVVVAAIRKQWRVLPSTEPFGASVQDALESEPSPKQPRVQEQANIPGITCLLARRRNNRLKRATVKLSVNISFLSDTAAKRFGPPD